MSRKKTTSFFSTIASVVFAVSLLFMSLVVDNSHVSADTMDHVMQNTQNCASGCTSNQRVVLGQEIINHQNKKDTPAPPPAPSEPYYLQFQSVAFPQPIFPPELLFSASFIPPDLTLLNSVFRI
ncbi:MAG: hypothetical protein ABI716_01390 [Candidatus Saccharibacteria bacterium]